MTSGDGLGAVLISRSQLKILRKIQKNLREYIPAIPRFLHVWITVAYIDNKVLLFFYSIHF